VPLFLDDRGINTFSPEGRLFQVEYAMEAVKMGSTVIGVQTKEGAILVVEKRVTSTLIEADTIEKVYEIDRHIGCAMSGLSADSGTLINHARNESAVREQFSMAFFNIRIPIWGAVACRATGSPTTRRFASRASPSPSATSPSALVRAWTVLRPSWYATNARAKPP